MIYAARLLSLLSMPQPCPMCGIETTRIYSWGLACSPACNQAKGQKILEGRTKYALTSTQR